MKNAFKIFFIYIIFTASSVGCGALKGGATTPASKSSIGGSTTDGSSSGDSDSGPTIPTTTCTAGAVAATAYIYTTAASYDGNLGGRTGADNACLAERTSAPRTAMTCNRVKALLSISAADEIRDLPSTCNAKITEAGTAIRNTDGVLVAGTWNTLLSDNLDAGILGNDDSGGFAPVIWTGSSTDGSTTCQSIRTRECKKSGGPRFMGAAAFFWSFAHGDFLRFWA